MRFAPMQPSPLDTSGTPFIVFCSRCSTRTSSTDVCCDIEGKAGDFYCQTCVVRASLDAGLDSIPYAEES